MYAGNGSVLRLFMADIEIEIDGKKLAAKPDQTVIQVADEAGIYIPRFCYHKNLTVAANCRMCLVEVEKSPKALPACATPVTPGMKVFTKSQKTIEAQRAVMEFLLINHPLDCPICDQGGECELQDLSMGYGSSHSDYDECKRAVADENLGPLIASDMTRCILCTRCVRFGDEVAGLRELGVINRGGHAEIKTFLQQAIESEVSGNIIDLCPVGALTSKPYRFTARAWELQQAPSISPHDCVGTNVNVHTRNGKVMRVVTRENLQINDTWISDRDRFSYAGLYTPDRLEEPMAKIEGEWRVVEWQKAFELISNGLQEAISEFGSDKLGALASPNSTVEEFYLLQKIVRGLGSPHIDHRLRAMDTKDQSEIGAFPGLAMPLTAIDQCDAIVLIGSNIRREQPLVSLRIRNASRKGAAVIAINPVDYNLNFNLAAKRITAPQHMVLALAELVKALQPSVAEWQDVKSSEIAESLAQQLQGKQNIAIFVGAIAAHHPQASALRYFAQKIAEATGATLNIMTDGANSAGAWLAGAIPHRLPAGKPMNHAGLNAYEMLEKARKAYLLLNVEPNLDCANAHQAIEALKQAKFVAALSMYRNPVLEAHAHVILPIAPFTETSGTFVNAMGEWQSFVGTASAFAASRPAWKILRVLGNFLHLEGFNYESSQEVKHEIKSLVDNMQAMTMKLSRPENVSLNAHTSLQRIGEIPIYATDSLVRRSQPLQIAQMAMDGMSEVIRLHPDTAHHLGLPEGTVKVKQAANEVALTMMFDERIAKDAVWIAGGITATDELGDLFGPVELKKM